MIENFRSWIESWEKRGWLARVRKPVEARHTVGGITRKLAAEKAVLFENVSGCTVPLVTNLFFSREALAASLGLEEKGVIPAFQKAMEKPRPCEVTEDAPFKQNVLTEHLNPLQSVSCPDLS